MSNHLSLVVGSYYFNAHSEYYDVPFPGIEAKANRWTNIIVGLFQIVFVIVSAMGETWTYYIFATVVEVALLSLIALYAWKWPKQAVKS